MATHPSVLAWRIPGMGEPGGCSSWGRWGSDAIEQLHFHFSLSCIGEGNGNPLQCSCLENPRDRGAWWAAVYRVAQSRPRLKRLSSSKNFLQFVVLHTVKGFSIVNEAEVDVFWKQLCFLYDPIKWTIWFLVPLPFLNQHIHLVVLSSCTAED